MRRKGCWAIEMKLHVVNAAQMTGSMFAITLFFYCFMVFINQCLVCFTFTIGECEHQKYLFFCPKANFNHIQFPICFDGD